MPADNSQEDLAQIDAGWADVAETPAVVKPPDPPATSVAAKPHVFEKAPATVKLVAPRVKDLAAVAAASGPVALVGGEESSSGVAPNAERTLDFQPLELPVEEAAVERPLLALDLTEIEAPPASDLGLPKDLGEFAKGLPDDGARASKRPAVAPVNDRTAARTEAMMRERFDSGDFNGALEAAEWLLCDQPGHEEAARYADSCREVLLQMYVARIGALDRVPSVTVSPKELPSLGLDHRSGFLLSRVDGISTFAEILDISGMPELESYRILCDLLLANVIAVR